MIAFVIFGVLLDKEEEGDNVSSKFPTVTQNRYAIDTEPGYQYLVSYPCSGHNSARLLSVNKPGWVRD